MKPSRIDYTQFVKIPLMPCPFCGGRATYMQHETQTIFWAQCKKCAARSAQRRAQGSNARTSSMALRRVAKDWNKRVPHREAADV